MKLKVSIAGRFSKHPQTGGFIGNTANYWKIWETTTLLPDSIVWFWIICHIVSRHMPSWVFYLVKRETLMKLLLTIWRPYESIPFLLMLTSIQDWHITFRAGLIKLLNIILKRFEYNRIRHKHTIIQDYCCTSSTKSMKRWKHIAMA